MEEIMYLTMEEMAVHRDEVGRRIVDSGEPVVFPAWEDFPHMKPSSLGNLAYIHLNHPQPETAIMAYGVIEQYIDWHQGQEDAQMERRIRNMDWWSEMIINCVGTAALIGAAMIFVSLLLIKLEY